MLYYFLISFLQKYEKIFAFTKIFSKVINKVINNLLKTFVEKEKRARKKMRARRIINFKIYSLNLVEVRFQQVSLGNFDTA